MHYYKGYLLTEAKQAQLNKGTWKNKCKFKVKLICFIQKKCRMRSLACITVVVTFNYVSQNTLIILSVAKDKMIVNLIYQNTVDISKEVFNLFQEIECKQYFLVLLLFI